MQRLISANRRTRIGDTILSSSTVGSGPPVVLIHGLSASSRWWERNVPALAERHQVHLVDLAGFGQSPGPFELDKAAATLARWMEIVGLERAAVVGHSMGGYIAAELAADHPARVDRLTLVAAALPTVGLKALPHPHDLLIALRYLPLDFIELLVTDLWTAGVPTIAGALLALLRADLRAKLSAIAAPTLLVWGEHDPLVPARLAHELARCVPCREVAIFKRCGHNPMWERPQAFNKLLLEFLAAAPSCAEEPAAPPARLAA
jgi:pimeloyl-ACP methyl ester carboxylesterase